MLHGQQCSTGFNNQAHRIRIRHRRRRCACDDPHMYLAVCFQFVQHCLPQPAHNSLSHIQPGCQVDYAGHLAVLCVGCVSVQVREKGADCRLRKE